MPSDAAAWAAGHLELHRLLAGTPLEAVAQAFELVLRSVTIDYVARTLLSSDQPEPPDRLRVEVEAFVSGQLSPWQRAELGALSAGRELISETAGRGVPITEGWVKGLHRVLCAPQMTHAWVTLDGDEVEVPLAKGAYKTRPNHVQRPDGSFDAHAPVRRVASEMRRLVAEVSSAEFEAGHPAAQAAYVLGGLLVIHPFSDGNGRTARALASVYLYRDARIPFLVFFDQRLDYRQALNASRAGDHQQLVDFVSNAGLSAMALMKEAILAVRDPRSTLERLEEKLRKASESEGKA